MTQLGREELRLASKITSFGALESISGHNSTICSVIMRYFTQLLAQSNHDQTGAFD